MILTQNKLVKSSSSSEVVFSAMPWSCASYYIVRLLPPKWYYFRGAGSKATCGYFNEKPHTIADDMVSHHVITLFFVLLATRRIHKTVPSVGWYILPPKWQKLW